jgi:hypothetical protein
MVVVHTYNHSTQGLRQEDWKFEANLSYIVRPCLKNENKTKTIKVQQ